jgi:hypothetical protein
MGFLKEVIQVAGTCTMTAPPWVPKPGTLVTSDGKVLTIPASGDVSGIPVGETSKLINGGWVVKTEDA